MIRTIKGCITFLLVLLNAIWVILIVTPLGLLRLVPIKPFQILVLKLNEKLAELYLFFNSRIQDLMHGADYRVEGMEKLKNCLLYTSPSPRDGLLSRMPSSA